MNTITLTLLLITLAVATTIAVNLFSPLVGLPVLVVVAVFAMYKVRNLKG